jgi:protein TonB
LFSHGEGILKVEAVMPSWERNPNWLLRSLIVVSLAIHIFIFMHITGLYRSKMLNYIELTLKDVSEPPKRDIPRPRHRPKNLPHTWDVKRLKVIQRPIPQLKPISIEPAERDLPDSLVERINQPDIPVIPNLYISDWTPAKLDVASDDYATPSSYLEMVKLKIEKNKKYPDTARIRHIEGSVIIRFVITPEGDIKAAEVVKTSRYRSLDTAALKAVKDAAPFPKPPRQFFKGEVPFEITILFELT